MSDPGGHGQSRKGAFVAVKGLHRHGGVLYGHASLGGGAVESAKGLYGQVSGGLFAVGGGQGHRKTEGVGRDTPLHQRGDGGLHRIHGGGIALSHAGDGGGRRGGEESRFGNTPQDGTREGGGLLRALGEVLGAAAVETHRGVIPQDAGGKLGGVDVLAAASDATVTTAGAGYATAMATVSTAVAPLTADGHTTRDIRLSVKLTASEGEGAHGSRTLEVLCGLYRAAAEGGMAVEDPVFTVEPLAEGQSPAVRLSVVAYRRA
jgi:hypothetical protein